MKPRVKVTNVLIAMLAIFSLLVLAGCVSTKQKFQDDMSAQGVTPLTAPEIKKLFANAEEHNKNPKYEFEGYYSADGKVKGRAWGSWGEQIDEGEWRVNDIGQFCVKYLGEWSKSGETCYTVYPGKTEVDYTLVRMTGIKSKGYPSGVKPIKVTPRM